MFLRLVKRMDNKPLRFTRRLSLIPGLRVYLNKGGASLSIGHCGAWYTVGPRGRRATMGLPGTGLFWPEKAPPASPPRAGHRVAFIVVVARCRCAARARARVIVSPPASTLPVTRACREGRLPRTGGGVVAGSSFANAERSASRRGARLLWTVSAGERAAPLQRPPPIPVLFCA